MTRIMSKVAAAAMMAACAVAPLNAGAQTVTDAPMKTPTIQQETTMSLSGTGQVSRAPDVATISVGVEVDGETAAAAMSQQSKQMNGVFAALKKAGVASKDMQTGNLSLNPRYDYSKNDGSPPRLVGYSASNTLNVTVRDLKNLGKALDSVVESGGNTINSISFGLKDSTEAMNEARQKAVKDALDRANLYAAAAGYSIARIITISEGGGDYYPTPVMMARAVEADASAPTPVSAGEVNYNATVSITFELTR